MTPLEKAIAAVLTPENIKAAVGLGIHDVGSGDSVTGTDVDWAWVAGNLSDELRQAVEEAEAA